MPQWTKTLTLIIVLIAYSATVIATLARGDLPDAVLIGIPIVAITALAPPSRLTRGRVGTADTAADAAGDEGDAA